MMFFSTKVYAANVTELEDETLYHAAYHKATDERRKKADSFRFKRDRQLSLGAELLLMEGLKDWGVNLKEIKYHYGANGKPYLAGENNFYFNLSHSKEAVVCAISSCDIGCDIEKVSDIDLKIAKRFFCKSEYEIIASCKTEKSKQEMFFRLWTLKESFIKLKGMGMSIPMNSFSIKLDIDKIMVEENLGVGACYFQELILWSDYKCSICGFDKNICAKDSVAFEILNFGDILN